MAPHKGLTFSYSTLDASDTLLLPFPHDLDAWHIFGLFPRSLLPNQQSSHTAKNYCPITIAFLNTEICWTALSLSVLLQIPYTLKYSNLVAFSQPSGRDLLERSTLQPSSFSCCFIYKYFSITLCPSDPWVFWVGTSSSKLCGNGTCNIRAKRIHICSCFFSLICCLQTWISWTWASFGQSPNGRSPPS